MRLYAACLQIKPLKLHLFNKNQYFIYSGIWKLAPKNFIYERPRSLFSMRSKIEKDIRIRSIFLVNRTNSKDTKCIFIVKN